MMKLAVLFALCGALLGSSATAGEVEVVLRGEVTINLSSPQPFEGSAMSIRLRVVTPGTDVIPGQQTEYQVVPESRRIHFIGIGAFPVDGPSSIRVANSPISDGLSLIPDDPAPALEMTGDVFLSSSAWDTTDLEQLSGIHSGGAGNGTLRGNGVWIEYGLHSLEVLDPSAGTTFCEAAEPNSTGYATYLYGAFNGPGGGLHLEAFSGPNGQFGLFVVGPARIEPGVALGSGRLCLAPSGGVGLGRYASGAFSSIGQFNVIGRFVNQSGTSSVGSGFDVPNQLPLPGLPPVMGGQTWHFQMWHRDLGGTSNLSNGLSVTF